MTGERDKMEFCGQSEAGEFTPTAYRDVFDDDQTDPSLLEKALSQANVGWWYWDVDERTLYWPDHVFPLTASDTESLDYERFLSTVHPADRNNISDSWEEILQNGTHELEYRLVVDGETRWIEQYVETAKRGVEKPSSAVGIIRDVTEEKKQNRELRSFREAVENAGHSIYWTNQHGVIQYVNPVFEKTTGYSSEEAVGRTPRILKSGEHGESFYADMWGTITNENVWSREIINERKNGDQYVANQTIAPVQNEDGKIERFVAVNTDITEQKKHKRDLEVLRKAIDKAHFSIVLTDPTQEDNPIVYVNDAFEELTGYTKSEVIGRNCRFLQGERVDSERLLQFQEALENEEHLSIELRNYRKDGTMFWNQVTVTPIYDADGNLARYLGTQRDVTRRREHEQRLTVFNRVFRHNLRNKLSVIVGYGSALQSQLPELEENTDGEQCSSIDSIQAQFNAIHEHAMELASLGEKVRQFQQVADGTQQTEPVDARAILGELTHQCAEEYPVASIEVEGESATVLTNREAFKLTINELLENAVIHSGPGQPQITVTVRNHENGTVTVHVADSGPGIPEVEQEVLTEGDESPLLHGSGFGLWMVNWLVTRLGGTISISENNPTGTVVTLTLPAANSN